MIHTIRNLLFTATIFCFHTSNNFNHSSDFIHKEDTMGLLNWKDDSTTVIQKLASKTLHSFTVTEACDEQAEFTYLNWQPFDLPLDTMPLGYGIWFYQSSSKFNTLMFYKLENEKIG